MSLMDTYLHIVKGWRSVFKQNRVFCRAARQSLSALCLSGRQTISQTVCFSGRDQQDWTADYRLHSSRDWQESNIFEPVLQTGLQMIPGEVIPVAFDDTRVRKTGTKILTARWQLDTRSPAFHVNLMWGLRFLQASLLLPCYRQDQETPPRAIPLRFTEVPHIKKPGKRAKKEEWELYRQESKTHNLPNGFITSVTELRKAFDRNGASEKPLLVVVDGSFCNRTCFQADLERTILLARARKDAKLCFQDDSGHKQRFYAPEKFTPEQVRQGPSIPWQKTSIYHGGAFREIRFKVVNRVLWQRGARKKFLKLLVIAPTPYYVSKNKRPSYRQPAYLLSTDTSVDDLVLIQTYFDRWQIEVNFREEKSNLGLGQAQVWNAASVRKQPAFLVASYAALLLASQIAIGNKRGEPCSQLPKWRGNAKRPSLLDLLGCMRREIANRPDIQKELGFQIAS